jgi:hypothetical protein
MSLEERRLVERRLIEVRQNNRMLNERREAENRIIKKKQGLFKEIKNVKPNQKRVGVSLVKIFTGRKTVPKLNAKAGKKEKIAFEKVIGPTISQPTKKINLEGMF